MAIFNKKPAAKTAVKKVEKEEGATAITEVVAKSPIKTGGLDLGQVLLRPHVTEKATDLSEKNVYAFEVNMRANKVHVRQAIEKLYKVSPVKIAMMTTKAKTMKNPRTNRTQSKRQAGKKALVYLKAGDKIEVI